MKTLYPHNLINTASKISACISNVIATVKEAMSLIDVPVAQPQRVRVAVRVENNPLPYRKIKNYLE